MDEDELAALLERRHATRRLMRAAYDRLDRLAEEVEVVAREDRIAMRLDLLIALSEAEHAARTASADMKDAEHALTVAAEVRIVRRRTGDAPS